MSAAALARGIEPSAVTVRAATDADRERWNAFVFAAPEATFFHRYEWSQVLERAFGHDSYYLLAEQDGEVVAVLPLAHVRSRLFSNALISTPFCVYGGAVARDEAARDLMLRHACELAARLDVEYLETRNLQPVKSDWLSKDLYVTFRKEILPDSDANLMAIPRKQRAMVRKGIEAGLAGTLHDDVDALYRCYSESVRNLGTPIFARRYLQVLQETFGDDCEIAIIHRGSDEVAAVMSFYFRGEVLPYYGGGRYIARQLKGNDFMYWYVMERARQRGMTLFDYGRSKLGTGAYSFKKNWGFEPQPLSYEYHLVSAPAMPDLSPNNPKYRLFIGMWQKLPLAVAERVGPLLAKSLG